jgi:hypothetical protein
MGVEMKKRSPLALALALAALVLGLAPTSALAAHNADRHSDNMTLLANYSENGEYGLGSDLAFWGTTAIAGSFDGPGGFRLLDISEPAPRLISTFNCPGTQADVSLWHDLAFVSVDAPRGEGNDLDGVARKADECRAPAANQAQIQSGTAWEGLRIVSIADRANPVQVAAVKTDCGSHTHTLIPDEPNGRLFVYVLSYPISNQSATCNALSHRKISVIEVPLAAPQNAKVVSTPSVSPAIGCHDSTIFVPRKLVVAACLTESQVWDVSNPANPRVLSRIYNPRINIHHSSTFSWDGNKLVIGDELGGAVVSPGCMTPEGLALGAMWFYDVKDPANPRLLGNYTLPQTSATLLCTAHLFNAVPLRSDKDILVASWYTGATTVVDFTDAANPKQIAFYLPAEPLTPGSGQSEPSTWSSYWYNGRVYSNNYHNSNSPTDAPEVRRGIDVFAVNHPDLADAITLERLNPQVQEPLPPPVATPGAGSVITLPPTTQRRCVSRRGFKIRLKAPKGDRAVSAVVFVNGRRAKVIRGKRLKAQIVLRGLPKGRFRVDITVRTKSGKRIQSTRHYRTCTPKRRSRR